MKAEFLPGMVIRHISWDGDSLQVLDQRLLPQRMNWIKCDSLEKIFSVIRNMNVRGAPLIGIVSAFGIVIHLKKSRAKNRAELAQLLSEARNLLSQARPTAVNLFWALDRMQNVFESQRDKEPAEIISILESSARRIWEEDIRISIQMAEHAQVLLKDGESVLTHCNAGALATGGYGTALGVFFKAKEKGKKLKVYVDETRPVLQGARLTCWELKQAGIDYVLITDNMAGYLMKKGKIKKIFLGADRVARNGGIANKIGTYSLAQLAHLHRIPFYVVAPSSSFDLEIENEEEIPIEERAPQEVLFINDKPIAPVESKVENPAFDLTPPELITALITEMGIIYPPFKEGIARAFDERRKNNRPA